MFKLINKTYITLKKNSTIKEQPKNRTCENAFFAMQM